MNDLSDQLRTLRKTCEKANVRGYKTQEFRDAMKAPVVLALLNVLDAYRDVGSPTYITEIEKAEDVLSKALEVVNG